MLGLPDAQDQKWFVFHISQSEELPDEPLFVTVKTIIDTTKVCDIWKSRHAGPIAAVDFQGKSRHPRYYIWGEGFLPPTLAPRVQLYSHPQNNDV